MLSACGMVRACYMSRSWLRCWPPVAIASSWARAVGYTATAQASPSTTAQHFFWASTRRSRRWQPSTAPKRLHLDR